MRANAASFLFKEMTMADEQHEQVEQRASDWANLYRLAIQRTERMVGDPKVQTLAQGFGLHVVNVTWEDTGRFKGSAVGPNISDMTIQVQHQDPGSDRFELACMPVIRYPNFSDLTGDVSPDQFFLLVGNEKGKPLHKITLRELLENVENYLTDPFSWAGQATSLLAPQRDSHVLVSAQACFLPVPKEGLAEFNPVLFNYQSRTGDPAVLAILATREGTSVTVIDNQRDQFQAGETWGQRLFFNANGERASLTGQRRSEFVMEQHSLPKPSETSSKVNDGEGLNAVFLIQVPLKQKEPEPQTTALYYDCMMAVGGAACGDIEDAVIGHGKVEGPFTEVDGLAIERDERFPIRVTVQFYKATSNGVVSPSDMAGIAEQIDRVYRQADYAGSLVVSGETNRPTEHSGPTSESPDWWNQFWQRHFANVGQTREEAIRMLERLLGADWNQRTEAEVNAALQRSLDSSSGTNTHDG